MVILSHYNIESSGDTNSPHLTVRRPLRPRLHHHATAASPSDSGSSSSSSSTGAFITVPASPSTNSSSSRTTCRSIPRKRTVGNVVIKRVVHDSAAAASSSASASATATATATAAATAAAPPQKSTIATSSALATSSNTSSRKTNHKQTVVSFDSIVRIKLIPSLQDYTKKHLVELYHTTKEYKAIRKQLFQQLKLIREQDILEGDHDDENENEIAVCARGLEAETAEGKAERRMRQETGRTCVLREQQYQREQQGCVMAGEHAHRRLAKLYSIQARDAVQMALEKAKYDALDAKEYLLSVYDHDDD